MCNLYKLNLTHTCIWSMCQYVETFSLISFNEEIFIFLNIMYINTYFKKMFNYIINYPQWQREFSTSGLKTVNHRTTLGSHIPDVKPRVKNSAVQNCASKPIDDQSGTAQCVAPTLHQLPLQGNFLGNKSARSRCVTQDMQDMLLRASNSMET